MQHISTRDASCVSSAPRRTVYRPGSLPIEFGGQVKRKDYRITILVVEDLPRISIEQNGEAVFNDTVKSIDDLKIFLEERLYKYFEA